MDDRGSSSAAAGGGHTGGFRSLSTSAIESVKSLEEEIDGVIAGIAAIGKGSAEENHATRALAELAEALAGFATRLRHEWQELDEMLDRVSRQLDSDGVADARSEAARASSEPRAGGAKKRAGGRAKRSSGATKDKGRGAAKPSEGLRVLVTQMAAAGTSPKEIEQRLRKEYGVKRARSLVDEILTP